MYEVVFYPKNNPICLLGSKPFKTQKEAEAFMISENERNKVDFLGFYRKNHQPFLFADIVKSARGKKSVIRKVCFLSKNDEVVRI